MSSHMEKLQEVRREAKAKTLKYITAAFGLVAGLAWNDAIKALINYLFPISHNSVIAKFVYAIIMTLVLVIISIYLVRLFKQEHD